jgi:hypothetical protein
VAASTLVVFALFRPLRRRVQAGLDHRFNRDRYEGPVRCGVRQRLRDRRPGSPSAELDRVLARAVAPTAHTFGYEVKGGCSVRDHPVEARPGLLVTICAGVRRRRVDHPGVEIAGLGAVPAARSRQTVIAVATFAVSFPLVGWIILGATLPTDSGGSTSRSGLASAEHFALSASRWPTGWPPAAALYVELS